jgi:hypothetical protein
MSTANEWKLESDSEGQPHAPALLPTSNCPFKIQTTSPPCVQELPEEIFDIEGLEELSLAGNCLSELPTEIGRLTSLKRLQLAGGADDGSFQFVWWGGFPFGGEEGRAHAIYIK